MAGKNKKKNDPGSGVLATNRKALRDFQILETIEAGIMLTGTEVKSVKQGHSSIQEGYVHIDEKQADRQNIQPDMSILHRWQSGH